MDINLIATIMDVAIRRAQSHVDITTNFQNPSKVHNFYNLDD